jgi:fibrillarin-like rRNA methylase
MNIDIAEFSLLQEPKIINHIVIQVVQLELYKYVNLRVLLLYTKDNNTTYIDERTIKIEGDEYNAWADDDSYLETLVLQKLGFNKKPSSAT